MTSLHDPPETGVSAPDAATAAYLDKRTLKKGAAGWLVVSDRAHRSHG
ncbi:hypothetical protein [Piscicoccus intestinalis]|nr:hypothetical protein [Piscicoccus intestinalis]